MAFQNQMKMGQNNTDVPRRCRAPVDFDFGLYQTLISHLAMFAQCAYPVVGANVSDMSIMRNK